MILESQFGTEKVAMELMETFLDQWGLPKDRLDDLKTLVSEGCLNAIEHGNQLNKHKTYQVQFGYQEGCLQIRIGDNGGKTYWKRIPKPHSIDQAILQKQDPRGWGLLLIENLSDRWTYQIEDQETWLTMEIQIP